MISHALCSDYALSEMSVSLHTEKKASPVCAHPTSFFSVQKERINADDENVLTLRSCISGVVKL